VLVGEGRVFDLPWLAFIVCVTLAHCSSFPRCVLAEGAAGIFSFSLGWLSYVIASFWGFTD
jgi:hypothetical protein